MSINTKINLDHILDVKLYKSNEYKKFKFLEYNRDINRNHVDKLKEELEKRNDLHLKPIIVTPNKEIVDGQHRFTAAKELGLYFYYLIDYEYSSDKLITHNTVNKMWSCGDSFKHFLEIGKHDYFLFKNLLDKYDPIPMDSLLMILKKGNGYADIRKQFREGNFKYELTKESLLTLEVWKSLKHELEGMGWKYPALFRKTTFLEAIYSFFTTPGVDSNRFFDKLKRKPFFFAMFASKHDFINWFADVYNYEVHAKNKVRIYKVGNNTKISFL